MATYNEMFKSNILTNEKEGKQRRCQKKLIHQQFFENCFLRIPAVDSVQPAVPFNRFSLQFVHLIKHVFFSFLSVEAAHMFD